jgi:hypothetical protein
MDSVRRRRNRRRIECTTPSCRFGSKDHSHGPSPRLFSEIIEKLHGQIQEDTFSDDADVHKNFDVLALREEVGCAGYARVLLLVLQL